VALRRFWIDQKDFSGSIVIEGDLFHHIREVCRFGEGDQFELLPGDGVAYLAKIAQVAKHGLEALILSNRPIDPLKKPWVHLALSVPRFPKVDFILEKAAELGVHTVSLFVSDYSFPRKISDLSESRMRRWEKINRSAAQQSGRGTLMNLSAPERLENVLNRFKNSNAAGLFPYEGESCLTFKAALSEVVKKAPEEIWIFVGSEGGFSEREVELFAEFGLKPMTMGSQILRVETACVAMASVIKYEFEI
jgi:16S rRNA (uracil1498-N3)-methyltransferase